MKYFKLASIVVIIIFGIISLLLISLNGEKEHLISAVQSGVSDYLVKPFSSDALLQKVLKTLKKAGKLKASHLKPKSNPISSGGFAADTVNVLTSSTPQAVATVFEEPGAPTAPKMKSKTAKDNGALGQAQIRFSSENHNCIIKRISEHDLMGIIRRPDNQFPSVLEQAVVDIAQPDNEHTVARLNGYVHQIACTEDNIDTRFLSITIRFVDDDPEKIAFLHRFIDMV